MSVSATTPAPPDEPIPRDNETAVDVEMTTIRATTTSTLAQPPPPPPPPPPPAEPSDPQKVAASDPNTPLDELMAIAHKRADLRPAVAENPSTYPDLLAWLGALGDPAVDQALAARSAGPTAPTRALAVPDRPQAPARLPQSQGSDASAMVPLRPGWGTRPGDPPGVQRWWDRGGWTNRITGGVKSDLDAAERAMSGRSFVGADEMRRMQALVSEVYTVANSGIPAGRRTATYGRAVTRSSTPSLGRPTVLGYQPASSYQEPPAVTTTVLITLFFGLFGLIPASMHSNQALTMGQPTNKYWKAFGVSIAIAIGFWILLYVILIASVANSVGSYPY